MGGTLQTINEVSNYIPSIIFKLYQRRLLDKNAEITTEEIFEAHWELAQEIKFLQYKQERLSDKQLMLQKLIEKNPLYASSQGFIQIKEHK